MKQQTAVEWLFKHIEGIRIIDGYEFIKLQEAFEQAKQTEKEQILDAIINNQNGLLRRKTIIEAEQYYNETFNK